MRCLVVLAALGAAGCAGAGAGGPAVSGGAASIAPAGVRSFVAVSSDLGSKRWHGLGRAFARQLNGLDELAEDEVDTVTLADGRSVSFVRPKDDAKLRAYAQANGLVVRKLGAWTALAKSPAALDEVAGAKKRLAQSAAYKAAVRALPDDTLVRAYASGLEAEHLFESIPGQLQSQLIPPGAKYRFRAHTTQAHTAIGIGIQSFAWLGGALTSTGDGVKLDVLAERSGLVADQPPRLAIMPTRPYVAALLDEIPAGVVGIVDFQVAPGTFEQLPELPAPFRSLFDTPDVTRATEIDAVLGGETALYLRGGVLTPELTLVTNPVDTRAALAALDSLIGESPVLRRAQLHRAVFGGQLVISTTQRGVAAFRSAGTKLSHDDAFRDAGVPDRTTGFVYATSGGALPLVALLGVPLPAGLPRLDRLTAYGGARDGRSTLTAFLDVG